MRFFRIILAVSFLLAIPVLSKAADAELRAATPQEAAASAAARQQATEGEKEGVPLKPVEIGNIGGLPITNSMVVTWIVALGIIVFAQIATRNIKQVPEGAQNFLRTLNKQFRDAKGPSSSD